MYSQATVFDDVTSADSDGEDLYRLYVQYLSDARAHYERTISDWWERERMLRACRILPREHFEARAERSASNSAAAFAEAVAWLRKGFSA